LVSVQDGRFVPMYFKNILDPKTKKMKVRMVDTDSESYYIANRYMIRLRKEDFDDPHELAKYAATSNMSLKDFRQKFFYLVEDVSDKGNGVDGYILQNAQTEQENLKKTGVHK
jgi:hypothetical protein